MRETALALLDAAPAANMAASERSRHISQMLDSLERQPDWAQPILEQRSAALSASHERLRGVIGRRAPLTIDAKPPDIIGCYTLVPAGG